MWGGQMSRERAAWGVILIVIGVIFLGERLNWGFGWNMGRLWPLILIALGAVQLMSCRIAGAVWLLFLGGLFLLHQNHILRLDQSWPLFIVAAGLGMLFNRSNRRRQPSVPRVAEPPAPVAGERHE
jgi:cell wall-active antibiotic response 4TMS protein YvqF